MPSKNMMVAGVIALIVLSIIFFTVTNQSQVTAGSAERFAVPLVAPFQTVVSRSVRFARDIWKNYFFIVSVAEENERLRKELSHAAEKNNRCREIELSNHRLLDFFNFKKTFDQRVLTAEVIGKDPSPWFKTVIIDKGAADGVEKGAPVVLPEGLVGQVVRVSSHYAKVLLIVDLNSAVDGLVQRTRARGIIKGKATNRCLFQYALRKHDIKQGDVIVSSGLDRVYPKGLRLGYVSEIIKGNSGIFQDVLVAPFVDFGKLEEVMVVMNAPDKDLAVD